MSDILILIVGAVFGMFHGFISGSAYAHSKYTKSQEGDAIYYKQK